MNRELLREHLAEAQRHVVEGAHHLARQRALIAHLRSEHSRLAAAAEDLLKNFEQTHAMHIADRNRLQAELDAASRCDVSGRC
jgi:HD superfamily phosphohydrolase YqeK